MVVGSFGSNRCNIGCMVYAMDVSEGDVWKGDKEGESKDKGPGPKGDISVGSPNCIYCMDRCTSQYLFIKDAAFYKAHSIKV